MSGIYPQLSKPYETRIIQEPFASLSCDQDIDSWRPTQQTAIDNLFLAGDYTVRGQPSTLEAAVKSGMLASECYLLSKKISKPVSHLLSEVIDGR